MGLDYWDNERCGKTPSSFDSRFFPYTWYVLLVEGDDIEEIGRKTGYMHGDFLHLSIGVLGHRI